MKADTNLIVVTTVFILLFGIISSYWASDSLSRSEPINGSWACTTDIRICPDGTTVGRTPPYCQFASCSR